MNQGADCASSRTNPPRRPEFIFFDLGNVLLKFDHEIACRQVAEVASLEVDMVRGIFFDQGLHWEYERGALSTREFFEAFCRDSRTQPDYHATMHALCDIFQCHDPVFEIAADVKQSGVRSGILSNTNHAHWQFCVERKFPLLRELFEVTALSFELRSMKPDAEIYHAAARLANVRPEQIFFVDDRPENVDGARAVGFDAVLFTTPQKLRDDLMQRGVLGG